MPLTPASRTAACCAGLIGLVATGCKMDSTDFQRAPVLEPIALEGPTPPPVATPSGEKLYQLLYAGEVGDQAAGLGQRARMLAWLATMELSDRQLGQLVDLLDDLDAAQAKQDRYREQQDARELARLGPVYASVADAYADGGRPDEARLAAFAADLQSARAELYAERDPHAEQLERVRMLLTWIEPWIASLSDQQRQTLSQCRFFLRRRTGPLLNPGDYGDLTGISWDGGDFRGVNTTLRDDDEHHMDIGGLWSTEFMRAPPNLYLEQLQLQALVLMALREPGLREAIAARRGQGQVTAPPPPPG